jgi:CheY-like chemotaxis protein
MLIVLVDDDPEDHEVFSLAIEEIDPAMKCIIAKDGNEALEILTELVVLPSYIFLDINMPVVGGKEVLQKVKSDAALKDIPVIMYSTSADPTDIKECARLGARDYLIKPNNFKRLVEGLKNILLS